MTKPYWNTLDELYNRFEKVAKLYNATDKLYYERFPLVIDEMMSCEFVDKQSNAVYSISIDNPTHAGISIHTNYIEYPTSHSVNMNETVLVFDDELTELLELEHYQFVKVFNQSVSITFRRYDVQE